MDILVTHVYDKLRFKYYFHAKLKLPSTSTLIDNVIKQINSGKRIPIKNLPECDVKYLQRSYEERGRHLIAVSPPICDLKILPNSNNKKQSKPMSTDITPSSNDNKPQESSFELYSVTYTKVIENKEALNIHQINALLSNPNVKSINIKK